MADHIQKVTPIVDLFMPVRGNAGLIRFNPRMAAISAETLAAGKMPPLPGFAPCASFNSNIFT